MKLPRITSNEIIRVLEKKGFRPERQSGSHRIFINIDGRRTTVPVHSGKILHPKTLKNILEDAEISVEELIELL